MTCKKCGKELEENTKICGACGEAVTETAKPKKKNKKLIAIVAAVLAVIVIFGFLGSDDDNQENGDVGANESDQISKFEDIKVEKSGDNYVFDITYEKFCEEIAETVASMYGGERTDFINYCKEISPFERTIDYYSGNLNMYTIGLESSEFSSSLMVLKAEIYVEPETNRVVCVTIFKANGSSTLDNFNMIANKASLILSGKIVADMQDELIKTVDKSYEQIHYFEYKDCGLTFEQQKNDVSGGDMRKLFIYPAESFEIAD